MVIEERNPMQVAVETPVQLHVVAWSDPVVEALAHRPGSAYIEAVWLGILGPTSTFLWMRLARLAASRPTAIVDVVDLAVSLGVGEGLGRNAPITRSLTRMVAFDAGRRAGDTLAVRLALPDIAERRTGRLSYSARVAHEQLRRPHS
jgi:hypothetical protein